MDLASLLQVFWIKQKAKEIIESPDNKYKMGETCPQEGKILADDQTCINNRVQPRL